MKKSTAILVAVVAAILLATGIQSPRSAAQNKGQKGVYMAYYIDQGDTIFYDELPPVWCFPKGTRRDRKDWRNYYKLVYNFNKVYPYAIMVSHVLNHVDSTIEANHFKRAEENRYTNEWQKQVLKDFEPIIRKMTVSQGQLLMRLVDRETSRTSYKIVKDYRSRRHGRRESSTACTIRCSWSGPLRPRSRRNTSTETGPSSLSSRSGAPRWAASGRPAHAGARR